MTTLKQYLVSQFGNPRGPVGALVGRAMAVKNRRRIAWAVSRLRLRSTDRVLEIGFGPGVSLQAIADHTLDGHVAGIDRSPLMVRQASRRLAPEIGEGRVEVACADVSRIPHADGAFTRVLTINSMMFWPRPVEGLREILRVLAPGGRIAVVAQPWNARTEEAVARTAQKIGAALTEAGFTGVSLEALPLRPVPCVCVSGEKPA